MPKYENTELSSYVITIDSDLDNKFKTRNEERWRNYNMLISSRQWDPDDKAFLDEAGRPAFAYNIISPVVKTAEGYQRGTRKKVLIRGTEGGDFADAQMLNKVYDWAWNLNDGDNQYSKALTDAIIGGWGWMYHNFSFEDDPMGLPVIEHIDPFRLTFDISVPWEKCGFVKDQSWLTIEELLSHYAVGNEDMMEEMLEKASKYFTKDPTKRRNLVSTFIEKMGIYAAQWWKGEDNFDKPPDYSNLYQYYNPDNGRFKTIELHEKRMQIRTYIYDTLTGDQVDVTDQIRPDKDSDMSSYDNNKLQVYKQKYMEDAKKLAAVRGAYYEPNVMRKQVKQTWITSVIPAFNMVVSDEPYKVQSGRFMYEKIEAYNQHPDPMQIQSVVDELVDMQRDYNKKRSTLLELITKFSAVGWTADEKAIGPYEDMWMNRKLGGLKYVTSGNLDKVKPDQMPQIPAEIFRIQSEDRELTYTTSGFNQASRGEVQSSTETGVLFKAKKEQSETMMASLFSNFDKAQDALARGIMADIQFFMDEERQVRITGEDGRSETLSINVRTSQGTVQNSIPDAKFDLQISKEPYGHTARERAFEQLGSLVMFLLQVNPQLAPKLIPIVVEASDNPYKFKILEAISQQMQEQQQAMRQASQVAQATQEIELAKNQSMVAEKQANTAKKMAEAEKKQIETEQGKLDLDMAQMGGDLGKMVMDLLNSRGS